MDLSRFKPVLTGEAKRNGKYPTITISRNQFKINQEGKRFIGTEYIELYTDSISHTLYIRACRDRTPTSIKNQSVNSMNIATQLRVGLDIQVTNYINGISGEIEKVDDTTFKVVFVREKTYGQAQKLS